MYIRFVTLGKDKDSKHKQGLITFAYDLRDDGKLDSYGLKYAPGFGFTSSGPHIPS